MNKITRTMAVLGVLIGVCAGPCLAQADFWTGKRWGERGQMRDRMEARIQEVYAQLGLSEEQSKLLDENKAKHKAARESTRKQLRETMQALGEELKQKDLDMAKIDGLRATLKTLRNQMADRRFEAILEVRRILTQEQFVKFSELIQHRSEEK